jgi:hypothetical protein
MYLIILYIYIYRPIALYAMLCCYHHMLYMLSPIFLLRLLMDKQLYRTDCAMFRFYGFKLEEDLKAKSPIALPAQQEVLIVSTYQ